MPLFKSLHRAEVKVKQVRKVAVVFEAADETPLTFELPWSIDEKAGVTVAAVPYTALAAITYRVW